MIRPYAALLLLILLLHAISADLHNNHHPKLHRRLDTEIVGLKSALSEPEDGQIYAVLVAGSNGWYNYRHQADVGHAYHTLVNHGIPKKNIITMMYDDIAKNEKNPYPGKLYNRPHGQDVYKNISIDYRQHAVTPENFVAVLTGDKQAIRGGNGRVLQSGPNDRVFIYFTDHGATGLISFPEAIMTVQTLNNALQTMNARKKYAQLTFYLEACESGSMFENVLKSNINVYAITAANGRESSWGTYCDNDMQLPCLGDLFSTNWMEDSDEEDLTVETLEQQFELVKQRTNKSHVMHFGDLNIAKEPVSYFQGALKPKKGLRASAPVDARYRVHWPSRDIELNHLLRQRDSAEDVYERKAIGRRIADIHQTRKSIKSVFHAVVHALVPDVVDRRIIFEDKRSITEFSCHNEVVHAFDEICIDFNKYEYAMKYVYVLANLCEELRNPDLIVSQLMETCPDAFFL